MTSAMMNWFSPSTIHALGWALVHFLWQGTAVAALAAVAMALCGRTSARYIVAVSALTLMFLSPLATFAYYAQQNSGLAPIGQPSASAAVGWPIAMGHIVVASSGSQIPLAPSRDEIVWLVQAWLVGVALFSLRSAGGFLLLERKRRQQSSTVSERVREICYTLQNRLRVKRAIQYCECKWLQAPAVIGWFRPIVFLPATALTGLSQDQLQAVIAHELAHIRRFDSFVNVFQVCVETLLFYHPAVWWLNKRIRAEREHCCDEIAVSVCGNAVEYARALTLMEEWRRAPVFALAANGGPLTDRIIRGAGNQDAGSRNAQRRTDWRLALPERGIAFRERFTGPGSSSVGARQFPGTDRVVGFLSSTREQHQGGFEAFRLSQLRFGADADEYENDHYDRDKHHHCYFLY